MRLIDADKLIAEIKEWGFIGETCAVEAVESAPSIDLILCKDCKHYQQTQKGKPFEYHRRYCNRGATRATKPNDFCSYGERSK